MLCDACQNIQFHYVKNLEERHGGIAALELREEYEALIAGRDGDGHKRWADFNPAASFHVGLSQAFESARKGCHLCNFLLEALFRHRESKYGNSRFIPLPLTKHDGICLFAEDKTGGAELSIMVGCGPMEANIYTAELPPQFAQICDYTSARHDEDWSTGSQNNISLAQLWLNDCDRSHSSGELHCHQSHSECWSSNTIDPDLPDYVIDVGDLSHTRDTFLTRGQGKRGRYATLSYCWGPSSHASKTTTTNLKSQKKRIDFLALPTTVQDAIHTTRALGIKFIWIDALCIIQDSQKHWEVQSSLMGSIYQNSTLTIAADAGVSAHLGLFVRRNPLATRPCRLPPGIFGLLAPEDKPNWNFLSFLYHDEIDPGYSVASSGKVPGILETHWPTGEPTMTENSPLEKRAWVLQESLLSRKVLRFTSSGISWQCATIRLYEGSPTVDHLGGAPPLHNPMTNNTDQPWRQYNNWYSTMEQYSERHMTFETDKFPALSALASHFDKTMESAGISDAYLAGLWNNDLSFGLLWIPSDNSKPLRVRPVETWIAPTWSWASLGRASIKFQQHDLHDRASEPLSSFSVEKAECEPFGSDPYGRVKDAFLQVRGLAIETVLFDAKYEGFGSTEWNDWLGLISTELGLVVGMIRLDEPGRHDSKHQPILCLPLLKIRHEYPSHVGNRIEAYDEKLSASTDEYISAIRARSKGEKEQRAQILERMKLPFFDRENHPDYDDEKEMYYREKRPIYCSLALELNTIQGAYYRVGIAEIWDLEWLEGRTTESLTLR